MPKDLPIDRQIHDLQASKYEVGWEGVKGFASRALPALVTFGIGAAVVTGVGMLALGFLGAMGVGAAGAAVSALTASFGGVIPAITGMGFVTGAVMGTATGLAGAIGARREAGERNDAMDIQIARLEQQAKTEGIAIEKAPVQERPNPARSSNLVQGIIEQGRQNIERTFSPGQIAQRAANDLTGGSFQERIAQERSQANTININQR